MHKLVKIHTLIKGTYSHFESEYNIFLSLNSQGGKTLLMVAAEEDKRSVVAVLLEHNTKMDLTDAVSACMYILL